MPEFRGKKTPGEEALEIIREVKDFLDKNVGESKNGESLSSRLARVETQQCLIAEQQGIDVKKGAKEKGKEW